MSKILKPRLLPLGSRFSQGFIHYVFSEGVKQYWGSQHQAKIDQIFKSSNIRSGNFVFNPEGMNMSSFASLASIDKSYKYAVETAVKTMKEVDTSGLNKVFISSEIPSCPPLDNYLSHPNTTTLSGYGSFKMIEEANAYLRLNPTHSVGLFSVEIPSRIWHTQFPLELRQLIEIYSNCKGDEYYKLDIMRAIINNIVAASLFRDNATFTVMLGPLHRSYYSQSGWTIHDTITEKIPQTENLLGTNLSKCGSHIFTNPLITSYIPSRSKELIKTITYRNSRHYSEINNFLVHPGSFKLLRSIQKKFKRELNLTSSYRSLEENGSCLSSSLFDVIHRDFDNVKDFQDGIIYGMGPGLIHGCHYVIRR